MNHTITITIKEPDEIYGLIKALKLKKAEQNAYFEFKEYCTFELEIDSALRVVSGRIVPLVEL